MVLIDINSHSGWIRQRDELDTVEILCPSHAMSTVGWKLVLLLLLNIYSLINVLDIIFTY